MQTCIPEREIGISSEFLRRKLSIFRESYKVTQVSKIRM